MLIVDLYIKNIITKPLQKTGTSASKNKKVTKTPCLVQMSKETFDFWKRVFFNESVEVLS